MLPGSFFSACLYARMALRYSLSERCSSPCTCQHTWLRMSLRRASFTSTYASSFLSRQLRHSAFIACVSP